LFSIGFNDYGIIGDDTFYSSSIKQIDYFKDIFIVDVAVGQNHCLSISNKGEIYSWEVINLVNLEMEKIN
jgi:alpha-tubulin suppressor-like RCC1 family protein